MNPGNARLVVLDGTTGKEISFHMMAGGADDLFYDEETGEIYIGGGEGYINIFRRTGPGIYKQVSNIPLGVGEELHYLFLS